MVNQENCKHELIESYSESNDFTVTFCLICDKTLDFTRYVSDYDLAIFGEY